MSHLTGRTRRGGLWVPSSLLRRFGLSLALTFGAVAAMTMLFPFVVAVVTVGVLALHEYGHYYSASMRGGNPDPPIIIPLGVGAIGLTRVRNLANLSPRARRYIVAAGPITGALTAVSLLPFAIMQGTSLLILTVFGLIVMEVYGGTVGSDGKRWREQREETVPA